MNNIFFSYEVIKGYNRKFLLFRCIIKIDFLNVYDFIEWRCIK